jgi:hypothetical protein
MGVYRGKTASHSKGLKRGCKVVLGLLLSNWKYSGGNLVTFYIGGDEVFYATCSTLKISVGRIFTAFIYVICWLTDWHDTHRKEYSCGACFPSGVTFFFFFFFEIFNHRHFYAFSTHAKLFRTKLIGIFAIATETKFYNCMPVINHLSDYLICQCLQWLR